MNYRIDAKSGNKLSVLGLGCMRFPRGVAGIDISKAEAIVKNAVDAGVNYLDTAYVYGGSEAALGEVFKRNPGLREKVYIATKLPHGQCQTYSDFDKLFNKQLERMGIDKADYYLIHNISEPKEWERLVSLGIKDWINTKKREGKISNIGFSFHGMQNGFFELLEIYNWDFCQIQYNYMNEFYQAGRAGLERAAAKGMPVIIMEPLLGGRLAKNLPAETVKIFNDAGKDKTPAAWALEWLYDQPGVTVVLSGMSAVEDVKDNLKTAESASAGMFGDRERAVIERARESIKKAFKVGCTGCNYCMPCPKGVNIPGCFAAYNQSYASGMITGLQMYLTSTVTLHNRDRDNTPKNCVNCGKCVKHCPQNIDIPNRLKDVDKRMEPFWFKAVFKIWMALAQRKQPQAK